MRKLGLFFSDESAATAIEYAVIVGLIGLGLIATLKTLGSQLGVLFDVLSEALADVPPPGNYGNGA